ncbi:hypothetical protein LUZ60_000107 [Juncus effusus]|nr:hypothetical protein LUZ60_000107 [Juncus effusus]
MSSGETPLSMSSISVSHSPHVAIIPSAGMGHITPFSRFAVSLSSLCHVTMVSILPTVSQTESLHFSNFFSSYPKIHPLHFQLPSQLDSTDFSNADPFFRRWYLIGHYAPEILNHLLINTFMPVSAIVVDIAVAPSFIPLAKSFNIPCYILYTVSAEFVSFSMYFPIYHQSKPKSVSIDHVKIPGLRTIPVENIPQMLHDSKHIFTKLFVQAAHEALKVDGILINTFESLEKEAFMALRGGYIQPDFPHLISVGPLMPIKTRASSVPAMFSWLDEQPEKSVMFVNFGNRTAMSQEQIRELGFGLELSGCRFIWIVKTTIVDKDDNADLKDVLEEGFLDRIKDRGMVIKTWIEQEMVLGHKAIGGFLSHCGWNSVTEAAVHGVRVLAWPRIGDQRFNADLAVRNGLGVWVKNWTWEGEEGIVKAAEISERVKELMNNASLMKTARKVSEEALKATTVGGSSYEGLVEFVEKLKG